MDSLLKLTAQQRVLAEAIAICDDELKRRLLLNALLVDVLRMSDLTPTLRIVREKP